MAALRIGQTLEVDGLPGKWSVWSQAGGDYGPGAYFIVPAEGGGPHRYEVIRVQQKRTELRPTIKLLSREAPR